MYMSLYFIDMELCDLNLQDYIDRNWPSAISLQMPFFTIDLPPRLKQTEIWSIMEDVTDGIEFIHSLDEVHRDIKPKNGKYLIECVNSSPLLLSLSCLENCRFWIYGRGPITIAKHDGSRQRHP